MKLYKLLWLFVALASAETCLAMSPEYSVYVTTSIDVNKNLYVVAVLDGTTTGLIPQNNNVSPTHQGSVLNQIGTNGGWVYGPKVYPTAYISVTNSLEEDDPIDDPIDGEALPDDILANVYCSIMGSNFFS